MYQICSKDGPMLTLGFFFFFTSKSNLLPYTFIRENIEKLFSQNVLKTISLNLTVSKKQTLQLYIYKFCLSGVFS